MLKENNSSENDSSKERAPIIIADNIRTGTNCIITAGEQSENMLLLAWKRDYQEYFGISVVGNLAKLMKK